MSIWESYILAIALGVTLGVFFGLFLPCFIIALKYQSRIFEIYQRYTWLQQDIRKLATKKEET